MPPRLLLPVGLLVGLLFLPPVGYGQRPTQEKPPLALRTYTRAEDLPSNYVLGLFQDRDGFRWSATDSGVARYDGRNFETFTTTDGLPGNFVYAFHQIREGVL